MVLALFFGTISTVAMTWISYSSAIVSFFFSSPPPTHSTAADRVVHSPAPH